MSIAFSSIDAATLTYTYEGVAVTKNIARQVFGTAAASCSPTTGSRAALTNYQDLWWNPAEAGWGLNVTHQNSTLFATLFTYNSAGRNLWLVMSAGIKQLDGSYLGDLYQVSGPAFNAQPFTPIGAANLVKTGTMRLAFTGGENGTLTYTLGGVAITKAITRQVFASPVPSCTSPEAPVVTVPTTPAPPTTPKDGPTLYANHCAACHGALASSSKAGATAARIQGAIGTNAGGMGYLSTLTAAEITLIADALAVVTPPPVSATCGSCHGLPPSTGRHSDHRRRSCSTCHGTGYSESTVNAATHRNGITEILASIGWTATTRSCANSCHGRENWNGR
jgi:mono/diheme cytochrome c family protein